MTLSQLNDDINKVRDELLGEQVLLDPEDADNLQYKIHSGTSEMTGGEGNGKVSRD